MYPPLFAICAADSTLTALIGTNPVRCFPFEEAKQGVALPYMVWQVIAGIPENYINQAPDTDNVVVQVDIYGATVASARDVAIAARDAIEPHAHITSWRGESQDEETKLYRVSFDVEWWLNR